MKTREINEFTYSFNINGVVVAEDLEDTHNLSGMDPMEAVEYAVDLLSGSFSQGSENGLWWTSTYIEDEPVYDDAAMSIFVARLEGFSKTEVQSIYSQVKAK
jgi:hypothetical protein